MGTKEKTEDLGEIKRGRVMGSTGKPPRIRYLEERRIKKFLKGGHSEGEGGWAFTIGTFPTKQCVGRGRM